MDGFTLLFYILALGALWHSWKAYKKMRLHLRLYHLYTQTPKLDPENPCSDLVLLSGKANTIEKVKKPAFSDEPTIYHHISLYSYCRPNLKNHRHYTHINETTILSPSYLDFEGYKITLHIDENTAVSSMHDEVEIDDHEDMSKKEQRLFNSLIKDQELHHTRDGFAIQTKSIEVGENITVIGYYNKETRTVSGSIKQPLLLSDINEGNHKSTALEQLTPLIGYIIFATVLFLMAPHIKTLFEQY